MTKVNHAEPKTFNSTAARKFCRFVINEVMGLYLAQTDTGLVLWALYKAGRSEYCDLKESQGCS